MHYISPKLYIHAYRKLSIKVRNWLISVQTVRLFVIRICLIKHAYKIKLKLDGIWQWLSNNSRKAVGFAFTVHYLERDD